jgi:hypothetical protein
MPETNRVPLSQDELLAEVGVPLPDKQVITLLDLNVDLDLVLDLASPIDLAIGGNANVAAPIDAAVGANVLSQGSTAEALADQGVSITQGVIGDATAIGDQDGVIDQDDDSAGSGGSSSTVNAGAGAGAGAGETSTAAGSAAADSTAADSAAGAGTTGSGASTGGAAVEAIDASDATDVASALNGGLLNLNVDVAADLDAAAPIAGAVALNANIAAPIDAALSANIGSDSSQAAAVAQQDAIITQTIEGDATASAVQDAKIDQ